MASNLIKKSTHTKTPTSTVSKIPTPKLKTDPKNQPLLTNLIYGPWNSIIK